MTDQNELLADLRNSIDERRLAVGAAELARRAMPPDLSNRILERLAAGERSSRPRRQWLLAAALIMFGTGVTWVIGSLQSRDTRQSTVPDPGPQPVSQPASPPGAPPQDPDRAIPSYVDVTSFAAIEELAADTSHVRGHRLKDADIAALVRLQQLRVLDLSRCAVTDACLRHLAHIRTLEHLALDNVGLKGRGFAALRDLPNLVRLEVRSTKIDAAGVAEIASLQSLRHLDISLCREFADAAMEHVLGMSTLQHLDLSGNSLVGEGKLLRLGELAGLRHLALAGIDGSGTFTVPVGGNMVRVEMNTGDGVGVDDRVLEVIAAKLVGLQFLDVAGCKHITDAGVRRLEALEQLHSLDLSRCDKLSAAAVLRLAKRDSWRLFGMPFTEVRVLDTLVESSQQLTEVRLSGAATTRPDLRMLSRLPALKVVQLDGMTLHAEDLLPLEACPALQFIRVTGCASSVRHEFEGLVGRAVFMDAGDDEIIQFEAHRRRR